MSHYQTNFFNLFSIEQKFSIDPKKVLNIHEELLNKFHPDRFVTKSGIEKKVALKAATQINDAYEVLLDPVKRAIHLCNLNGFEIDQNRSNVVDPSSLEIQMNLREELSNLKLDKKKLEQNLIEINHLELKVKKVYNSCIDRLSFLLDKIDTFEDEKKLEIQNQINILNFSIKFCAQLSDAKRELS